MNKYIIVIAILAMSMFGERKEITVTVRNKNRKYI